MIKPITIYFFISGNFVLCSAMVMEELGGWEDTCTHDGPGHWGCTGILDISMYNHHWV